MDERNREQIDSYETKNEDINKSCEINTYDSPIDPLSLTDKEKHSRKSQKGILGGIYKFVATAMVILTVIFATSELIDFLVSDMDTGNILFRRIFGSSASSESANLLELILEQTFGELPPNSTSVPSQGSPQESTSNNAPIVEGAATPSSTPTESTINPTPSTSDIPSAPSIPENAHPIVSMDLSLISYGSEYIYNDTMLSPKISELISADPKSVEYSEGPLVLVIHTHGTESFMPEGASYYVDDGELARSEDPEKNMVAVGKEFVRILNENGIEALHCVILHDKESYRESYSRSAETISYYLEKYPSIQYVFDLHRDSVMKSDESLVSAVTKVNGERVGQIMPVVGGGFSGYEDNLSFALRLRKLLNDEYGTISRPVCLRQSQYNQALAPVSVLLEIGTSGNSLDEAIKAARLTANAVSVLINEQCYRQ